MRPHHAGIDAFVVAAWCRVAAGDLHGADRLSDLARIDADQLGWLWQRLRVGVLLAEIRRLRRAPQSALDIIEALRTSAHGARNGPGAAMLDLAEAMALTGCGDYAAARRRIEELDDGPRARLERARLEAASRSGAALAPLLEDRLGWTAAECLEADVILATAPPGQPNAPDLAAVLEAGRRSGRVSPFLGHDEATGRVLRRMPLERLHPALAEALRRPVPRSAPAKDRRFVEPLTRRELTVLELLPTHLSYAQIGERLYLSVNTIKTNLKSLYRKLLVESRAQAVETAVVLGLLDDESSRFTPGPAVPVGSGSSSRPS